MLAPVIMASLPFGKDSTRQAALRQLTLTHDSKKLATYADKYAGLLYDVSMGNVPLKEAVLGAAKSSGINLEKVCFFLLLSDLRYQSLVHLLQCRQTGLSTSPPTLFLPQWFKFVLHPIFDALMLLYSTDG